MFSPVCFIQIVQTVVDFTLEWAFYIQILNEGGHPVFYSNPNRTHLTLFEFLRQQITTIGSLSCLEGEGEVRGNQLQHATSPLDVTKLYTLNL